MKNSILKHLRILSKGIIGISIELGYPVLIVSIALLLSGVLYFAFSLKK